MKRILITGATGNVGYEVIRSLFQIETNNQIIAGVRNIDRAKKKLKEFNDIQYIELDFEDLSTFDSSLEDIDTVFLLRPPHISDVKKFFKPLIDSFKKYHVKEVVFLSVQGAERSNIIPHAKIEKLIIESKIDYIFLRPGYFMQNLTTTLLDDIKEKNRIFLPAGKAKFNWIDVQNIGETAAMVLEKFEMYKHNAFEITGYENLDFGKVAEIMSGILNRNIEYKNSNLISFYRTKRREGIDKGFVLVMIMLHFFPQFGKDPAISNFYEEITGKKPTKLADFIEREQSLFKK